MSKPPATWKMWERRICAVFGLKRRGADYGDIFGGKNDAVQTDGRESEWWSLEVKHGKRITFQLLLDACRQAEGASSGFQEPVVVAHRERDSLDDCLVVQRLATFRDYRLSAVDEGVEVWPRPWDEERATMRHQNLHMSFFAKGKHSEGIGNSISHALSKLNDNDDLLSIAVITLDLGQESESFAVDDRTLKLPGAIVAFIELDLHGIGAQYAPHWES